MPTHALIAVFDPSQGGSGTLGIPRELAYVSNAVNDSGRLQLDFVFNADIDQIRRRLTRRKQQYRLFHFSGHSNRQGLILGGEDGRPSQPDPQALSDFLRLNAASLRCVLLNSCDGLDQAQKIATWIPYVIAMNGPIFDESAIAFARVFYQCYQGSRTVPKAFEQAVLELRMQRRPDSAVPRLFTNGQDVTPQLGSLADTTETVAMSRGHASTEPVAEYASQSVVPILRLLSDERLAAGAEIADAFLESISRHELLDDLALTWTDGSVGVLRAHQGHLTISGANTRYVEITVRAGRDLRATYHPPRFADIRGADLSIVFDGWKNRLSTRLGGREVFVGCSPVQSR